jgi:uncharacterized protein YndB with AHSA1/START domain
MGMVIGPLHMRRSIFIEATPARVWQEFESFDRVAAWLSHGHTLHRFEPRVGGEVEFSVDIDGARQRFGGPIVVFEPAREVSFESNWDGQLRWPVPTFWTIRLASACEGTVVELFHHGFERLGVDAGDNLEGYEEGWDVKHLKALRAIVNRAA